MDGNATQFVREDALEAAWAMVDPVLANATNLRPYEAGSWEPREVDRLAMNVDGWDNPEEHLRRALSVPRTPRIQPGTQYADSNLKVAIGWSRMGWIIF